MELSPTEIQGIRNCKKEIQDIVFNYNDYIVLAAIRLILDLYGCDVHQVKLEKIS